MPQTDKQRFLEALDRFGPDMGRWPLGERGAGETLLASDAEARRQFALAERTAILVRHALHVEAPPHLASRIIAAAATRRERPAWRRWLGAFMPRRLATAGVCAAIALVACGALIGRVDEVDVDVDEDATAIVALLMPADLPPDEDR